MTKLSEIEGIGEVYADKLKTAGIVNQAQLLNLGSTAKGRRDISEKTGLSEKKILNWANRADLARIKGVGEEYADLLEHAGVDSVPELAQRNADNLAEKLLQVNNEKNLVRKVPSSKQVINWVTQAKDLPRILTH